jgi:hypothetical protein
MDFVAYPPPSARKAHGAAALSVGLLILCIAAGAPALRAQEQPDPLQLLKQLNELQLDPAQIYFIRDTQITRGRANIYFNRGFIGFLAPVAGEITGAVFEGDGEILLVPPSPAEKLNLVRFTDSPILTEKFTSAYMRFTDQTAKELLANARRPEPDDVEQPTGFLDQWNSTVRLFNQDYSMRVLQDLLGDRTLPFFHAHFQGVDRGIFELSMDDRLLEDVQVGAAQRSHGELFSDVWCSFASRDSESKEGLLRAGSASVRSYKIDTKINEDHSLVGRAELELQSNSSADRVLVLELSRRLSVTEVKDGQGNELGLIQNPSLEESETAARGNDWVVVVLPAPVPAGQTYRLSFSYIGNVIAEVGNGVLYVGARGSWYPNRGIGNRATYDLTFQYPEQLTLVATGNLIEEHSSDGWKHSHWVSPAVFAVAGFNLGAYNSQRRKAGNTLIEVYAAREAEGALETRNVATQRSGELVVKRTVEGSIPVGIIPRPVPPLDPTAALDGVAETAAAAVQYFETLFGPFPYPRLAISQAPGHFGQGWPGLVYLPTLSFLAKGERSRMGLGSKTDEYRSELSVAHEIAHQWWGNRVGWKSYRDQWLSEGFATYAAVLNAAREKDGQRTFREVMKSYKDDLLSKTGEGRTVESGGPIWLGHRLRNSRNPGGYTTIVYEKSCWVLHMLRMLMADPETGSDERFFQMLREFATANWDREVSTQDFIRQAEKYMTPQMDLEGDGHLDWFFSTWVYGVGIPTYTLRVKTGEVAAGKFIVEGEITQSNVSPEFEMMVPLVAEFTKGKSTRLGLVRVTEDGGKFRFTTAAEPSHVAIDEENLLAVVD